MFKHAALFALVGIFTLGVPGKPASTAGNWQVDTRHSSAQLITDGTTDYGKTKMQVTLGFTRIVGRVNLDDADPAKSTVDLTMYPATSMMPPINEDGKILTSWLADPANNTLVCFHAKSMRRLPDGRLEATGKLFLTRVDRNVDATPNEAYSGPVYGPPIVHRVSREATFVFDAPAGEQKDGGILLSGSTSVGRENFPQLLKTVVSTYWPPVVQDENCQTPAVGEAYSGSRCTGTVMEASALPMPPGSRVGEDFPAPDNFNAVVGNQLDLVVHVHLMRKAGGESMAAGI